METYDAVRTVLAIREFKSDNLPEESVRKIVEAAHLTGSSMNAQPWHFIVVQRKDLLHQLGNLVSSGPYIADSSLAVVVATEKNSVYGISDASRAIQSMILTAWSVGIGSNWAGWVGMEAVGTLLNIPDSLEIVAVIPFGVPKNKKIGNQKKTIHWRLFNEKIYINNSTDNIKKWIWKSCKRLISFFTHD